MSDTDHSREEIAAWALSLKFFRFCEAYLTGPLRDEGERLLVAIRIDSEQDLVAVFGRLGIPVERVPADAPQRFWVAVNEPSPITQFPNIYQPKVVRLAGVSVYAWVRSDRVELDIKDEQDPYVVTAAAVQSARSVEPLLIPLADRIIDPPQDNAYCISPKFYPQYWVTTQALARPEKPDPLAPLNEDADYRQCGVCSQLSDHEHGFQKLSQEPENTYLPAAANRLQFVRNVVSENGGRRELWQCPECTTCYLYRTEYEFLYGYGGSEDTQELTRLTAAETVEWLKRVAPSQGRPAVGRLATAEVSPRPPRPIPRPEITVKEASKTTKEPGSVDTPLAKESVSVDTSEPGFISVNYVQLDDGLDMGGRLLLERKSVPLIVALLHACLNVDAFPGVECQCGDDALRVYGSGSDQQPIINILNRRSDGVPHGGLTGLMMTVPATEALFEQLRELN
jgi:hypothetical protein